MLTLPTTPFWRGDQLSDRIPRSVRLRYTATGAVAALAAAGAIAVTVALADPPPAAKAPGATKAPGQATVSGCPVKTGAPQPAASSQPFLSAVQRLVEGGTITAAEGQAVDREIQTGRVDTQTLSGFTESQLRAVQDALANTKRALAPTAGPPAK